MYICNLFERLAPNFNFSYFQGEKLTSYLHRYPIGKLTTLEALRVENLLITLELRKPILKASDLFSLDLNLSASVRSLTFLLN